MKNTIQKHLNRTAILALIIILLGGCKDYFENPLKDKETGEDINLLILDFNFFNSRMTFKLFDAEDSSLITLPADIRFSGKNGDDIVTFSGEKKPVHSTTQSQIELTIDPNVIIVTNSPFEFAINVETEGYNTYQKGFQFSTEGKKTYELYLVKPANDDTDLDGEVNINDGDTSIVFILPPGNELKSAMEIKPYEVHHKLSKSDFLSLLNTAGEPIVESMQKLDSIIAEGDFATMSVNITDSYAPGVNNVYYSGDFTPLLFHQLESGTLTSFIFAGEEVADLNGVVIKTYCEYMEDPKPDLFGFADFIENNTNSGWVFNEPIIDTLLFETLELSYNVAQASTETLCETGSSITFSCSLTSSFSIDADVYDEDNNWINSINFKGNFPETFTIENAPARGVRLEFRDNNPSFITPNDLIIPNLCEESYNVAIEPVADYESFQIVLKAICPSNTSIAVAPTYSAEIKIKNTDNPWQGVDMIGGKVDLLGIADTEYELQLLWEDEYESSSYSTSYDKDDGSYTGADYPKTVIESEYIDNDTRIRFNVEKEFNQNVCNDLGW